MRSSITRRAHAVIACAAVLTLMVGAIAAQPGPARVFTGPNPGDKLGEALAAVPDITGDGRPEILVGVFRADRPASPTTIADAGAAWLVDGARLTVLRKFQGEKTDARLGYAVAGVPDIDGDGAGDLLLGAPRHEGVAYYSGRVYVHSGKTGALITSLDGAVATAQFGFALAGLDDLDGDNRGEILIGAWAQGGTAGKDAGRVFLYSGKDRKLLKEWQGEGEAHYFGVSVAGVPDADGDGKMDVLIGAHYWNKPSSLQAGKAYLYSGTSYNLIRAHEGEVGGDLFGWAVAGVPDTNGDGRGDYLVGARDFDLPNQVQTGKVYLFSGKDGSILKTFHGEKAYDNLGRNVAGVPDLDGDGAGDLILPAHRGDSAQGQDSGWVSVRSGATGKELFRHEGEHPNAYLGWGVAGAGDLNGDGRGDVLIGSYQYGEPGKVDLGRAYVFTQGLTTAVTTLSGGTGGTINLTVDLAKVNATRPYAVAASLSGSRPGLRLPKVYLPLTFDSLFLASLQLANTPIFGNTIGTLDATGQASAAIRVPGGLSSLVGTSFTFAGALVDKFDTATNPVAVMVVP